MQFEFYKDLVESTRCGILTIDRAGRLTTANALARKILELTSVDSESDEGEELRSRHPHLSRMLIESLQMENPPSRVELTLEVPGNPRRVIGGSVSHIRNADGKLEGVAFLFKDLTTVEQQEEQARLKERLAAIGEMAAGLAHEIRNPLGNIGSTASLLKRKLNGNDSGVLALNNIVQEVQRLNQTVTECLQYAKPVNLKLRPMDLPAILRDVVHEVQRVFPKTKVMVSQVDDPRVGKLVGDPIQIRQVLHNLVANAFEAMEDGGNLSISTRLEDQMPRSKAGEEVGEDRPRASLVVVRIRDTGRGITPEVREKLFFPFFTTKPGGSGIGLAVAKKIVDTHGGIIDVESEPGIGSTFSVKLPHPSPPPGP